MALKDVVSGAELDLPCENCGRKTRKTIGWIKTHKQFTCGCGTVVRLDTDQFNREIRKVEAAFTNLERSFKGLGKRK